VVAIEDLVPKDQEAKIQIVRQLRSDLTPRLWQRLSPEQHEIVARYLRDDPLSPIVPATLPPSFTTELRERDGTFDKAILVYPHPSQATWQAVQSSK
jgi:hypothetical protein